MVGFEELGAFGAEEFVMDFPRNPNGEGGAFVAKAGDVATFAHEVDLMSPDFLFDVGES